ncbi:hypothetical protein [Methylocella sp.]|jgi:AraC-like DNA-binding protein|uniref:hypothetical protein n=1 Tax=Methylocella sp. TaxID=1978226 RepID=UPI003C173932
MTAQYEPTADQRALVENASAFGLRQSEIAAQLKIDEKTLRKHFRAELDNGKFNLDLLAGGAFVKALKSDDERIRLDAAKYYTSRRMGWKETTRNENVGADGGAMKIITMDMTPAEAAEAYAAMLRGEGS